MFIHVTVVSTPLQMTCGFLGKRRNRSRSLSDSGLQAECSQLKGILKKNSSFEPRVSRIHEIQESVESICSTADYSKNNSQSLPHHHQQSNGSSNKGKSGRLSSDEVLDSQLLNQLDGESCVVREKVVKTRKPSAKRSNFIFRALWRTRHKFNFLIKR